MLERDTLQQQLDARTYTLHSSVAFLIRRSHALWCDLFEPALSATGFTYLQYAILMLLRDHMLVNPKDICREFHRNSGALTRVLDQLCDRGLLERDRSARDRRKVDLRLTAAGHSALDILIPIVVTTLNSALGDFTHSEMRDFTRLLAKFSAKLEAGFESTGVVPARLSDTPKKHYGGENG
jgi:DNA-binding MarR family transcriptional regulator